jgi:hypothetical protein
VHDFNGGILPSGLFWVVELPDDAFKVGFSFKGRADTGRGFAQLGPERNGIFLSWTCRHPLPAGDVLTPPSRRGTKRRMSVSTGS